MGSSTPRGAGGAARARRRARRWIPWILLVAGVLLLTFPKASALVRQHRDAAVVQSFESRTLDDAERKRLAADVARYNKQLANGRFNTADPFVARKGQAASEFSQAGGVVAVLKIPKLRLELPVYYGTDDVSLAKGVGLMENTSFPGSTGGNAVLTGHRGMHDAQLFRHLEKLQPGDPLYFVDGLSVKKYVVGSHDVVLPTQTNRITRDPRRDQVTLVTCDPYLVNTHRLLVFSDRSPISKAEIARFGPKGMPATGGDARSGVAPLGLMESLAWMLGVVLVLGLVRAGWRHRRRRAARSSAQVGQRGDRGGLGRHGGNQHQGRGGEQGQGCDSATKP